MSVLAIFAPRRFWRLLASDAMNISRDPMLMFAFVLSVLPGVGLFLGREAIDAASGTWGIAELHRYFVPVVLVMPAILIGWVVGFLLIEDRDDGPLLAVEVTPVGKGGFMAYRLAVGAVLAAIITALALLLLLPQASPWLQLVLLATVPIDTALVALALLALARNKVEGLAVTKLTNFAAIAPLVAAVPSPFRVVAGVVPTYWIGELLHLGGDATFQPWITAAGLVAAHGAAVVLLSAMTLRRKG
ncbi:MAG: hypothetical protein ABL866_04265 [Devosia sp.]